MDFKGVLFARLETMSKCDFELLTIGKFYSVPCLKASVNPPNFARVGEWIPVLLPEHDDKEIIGFPFRHYHLDFRFLSVWDWENVNRRELFASHQAAIFHRHPANFYTFEEDLARPFYVGSVEYRKLKCKRQFAGSYPKTQFTKKLADHYAGSLVVNGRCPHKGADLFGCSVVNGVATCPMHGLKFSAETGLMVRG